MTSSHTPAPQTVRVAVESFVHAESDLYFSAIVLNQGGFGKFEHTRELSPDRSFSR